MKIPKTIRISHKVNQKPNHNAKPITHIPKHDPNKMKIAIVQTGCFGDNINSTLMLQPIRNKYDDCIIDIHTSTSYASAFANNPLVDNIIQYQSQTKEQALHLMVTVPPQIKDTYDLIIASHPMFKPGDWASAKHPELGENLIYSWVNTLESLDIDYDMPLCTTLKLTDDEVRNAKRFIESLGSQDLCLMEIHGESGQSFWDGSWTEHALQLANDHGMFVLVSRGHYGLDMASWESKYKCKHTGKLTLRECAEVFNHCIQYIGVSSGLNNVCNTDWCRNDTRWVEVINTMVVSSAPIRKHGKKFITTNDKQLLTDYMARPVLSE